MSGYAHGRMPDSPGYQQPRRDRNSPHEARVDMLLPRADVSAKARNRTEVAATRPTLETSRSAGARD